MNDLFSFTVPVFIKMLGGLNTVLAKAEAHLKETGKSEAEFLADRLAPDMFPFVKQVQVATDNAKGAAARLAGMEVPVYEDKEGSLRELMERVNKTIKFLHTFSADSFKNAHEVKVTLPYFPGKYMPGIEYAREYAVPNFFFHTVTAYDIARKNGVTIGKSDYMNNSLPLKDLA